MNHGTRHTYCYYKCRCIPCTEANRDYLRGWIADKPTYYRERRAIRKERAQYGDETYGGLLP